MFYLLREDEPRVKFRSEKKPRENQSVKLLHSTEHVNPQRDRGGLQIEINAIKQQSVNDRFVRNIS